MTTEDTTASTVDVLVVGAGFSGLYALRRLREAGCSVLAVDEADDVGGTWYWNRYPGARCDVPTTDYAFSFDPELERDWTWSEKYATQPEILDYLRHVADRYDLRRYIQFSTRLDAATWDDDARRWRVTTSRGEQLSCQFLVMATGCLSLPKMVDIPGAHDFRGKTYFTSRWPHEGVDFTGKRVAVIGTGSSGIQSIPLIAAEAAQLTVFQRTPNFSIPAHNGPVPAERVAALKADRDSYREAARWSRGGVPADIPEVSAVTASEEVRRERFEAAWEAGELFKIVSVFSDQMFDPVANEILSEMIREKIRHIVDDPETAETLCPKDHPFGTKRPCLDSNYYQTFNLPHVRLVDLRKHPITGITETGINTADESFEFDAIVYAIGFDAMTGPIVAVNVTGRDGLSLREKWADGPSTYLGLTTVGFPNFFAITGPGSPSVLSNMAVSIEQHIDWLAECVERLRADGFDTIEPTPLAEAAWDQHVADCGAITLHPRANSWYMGSNVPGKPRVMYPYIGGVDTYRAVCDKVTAEEYLGFTRRGPEGVRCHDGVVFRLQPDVAKVLEVLEELNLPTMDSLSVDDARDLSQATAAERPPGPEVGDITDGELPGPAGGLRYRCYRPAAPGAHPIVVYFHGGGWVLGDQESDDPLCRDLCARSGLIVVSVNYRHAPEARFPAAVDDALAAVQWVASNATLLGGIAGQLAVAGWSAGGNLAAVVSQLARDAGGPEIAGQLLLCPVTDCDLSRPSYEENQDGYMLTASLMRWFWDLYTDPADRTDPKVSPLRAADFSRLPPALVVTAEFDPLRDEGIAYAEALEAAGVAVRQLRARGHLHTSIPMVDVVLSGAPVREEMAACLRGFFGAPQEDPTARTVGATAS